MNKYEVIKATILGEEHLGENLKGLCIEYIDNLQQENQKYKEVIDKARELLGNYKHYSIPDEKQNSDNEDLVNNAFGILKGVDND